MTTEVTVLFGNNGYIGSQVYRRLVEQDAQVITADIIHADILIDAQKPDFSFLSELPYAYDKIAIINCIGFNHKVEAKNQVTGIFDQNAWSENFATNVNFPFELIKVLKMKKFHDVMVDVILLGSLYAARGPREIIYASLEHMKYKDPGYVASKHALSGLIKADAQFRHKNYRVNLINPGAVFHPKMGEKFLRDFEATFGAGCNNLNELSNFIIQLRFAYWTLFNFSEVDLTGGALR
jgi:NAD(P)-dependent dehydrogenase (short-subunit alcohol dehydrogenase family)